jgi:hypothetical protein
LLQLHWNNQGRGRRIVKSPHRNGNGRVSIAPSTNGEQSARAAGLRYVDDAMPGIRRVRAGKGFRHLDPDGKQIRDLDELQRMYELAIPPAWTGVWICPLRQATYRRPAAMPEAESRRAITHAGVRSATPTSMIA